MASKKTLNAENLERLGASRLAQLLMEISAGNAAAKRRLRLELADAAGPAQAAREIRAQLNTIARTGSLVDRDQRNAFVADLESKRQAIIERVSESEPAEALDLLWQFMGLASSAVERAEDRSGVVIGVFQAACGDLGEVAARAQPDPKSLAERVLQALAENDYGQYDHLIAELAPALGTVGLDHLKQLLAEWSGKPAQRLTNGDSEVIGFASDDPVDAEKDAFWLRDSTICRALQEIADALGDVDAFIAQQSETAKTVPMVAAQIAQRLLAAGRTSEAWDAINAIDVERAHWIPFEWEQTRLEVMETLGRPEEAQLFRWACFERSLEPAQLRSYLKRLPEFDDAEAEERALAFAVRYPNVHRALAFLLSWPAVRHAEDLVLSRAEELDGYHYEILGPAADMLEAKHPLAATVLHRTMIDFALAKARSTRYRHAARHLLQCESLAERIPDYGRFEEHDAYLTRIRKAHGRKTAFWSLVI